MEFLPKSGSWPIRFSNHTHVDRRLQSTKSLGELSQHNTIPRSSKALFAVIRCKENRYLWAGHRGRQSLPNSRSNSVRENYFRTLKRSNTTRRYVMMSQAKHSRVS